MPETAFDLFQAVVDAVAAADRDKAVQQVGQVLRRDLVDGEIAPVNAPLDEIRTDDFAGVLFIRFVLSSSGSFNGAKWLPSVSATTISVASLVVQPSALHNATCI